VLGEFPDGSLVIDADLADDGLATWHEGFLAN
jgi:hypothetical protein